MRVSLKINRKGTKKFVLHPIGLKELYAGIYRVLLPLGQYIPEIRQDHVSPMSTVRPVIMTMHFHSPNTVTSTEDPVQSRGYV